MSQRLPIFAEIDGASSHRLCGPDGPFRALMRSGCQSYMETECVADARRAVDYFRAVESVGGDGLHCLLLDWMTFLYIGRCSDGDYIERGVTKAPLICMSEEEFVRGYEQGYFDHKWASKVKDWETPEFVRVATTTKIVMEAGLKWKIPKYINFEGGANAFDPLLSTMNGRIIWKLLGSAKFRRRLPNAIEKWTPSQLFSALSHTSADFPKVFPAVQTEINDAHSRTVYLALAEIGCLGDGFLLSGVANPTKPCIRQDGRPQVASKMMPGQKHNMGWYRRLDTLGHLGTAACVAAQECYPTVNPCWMHFQLDCDPAELSARLRFARGPSIVFSETGDVSRLAPLADAIGEWRGR